MSKVFEVLLGFFHWLLRWLVDWLVGFGGFFCSSVKFYYFLSCIYALSNICVLYIAYYHKIKLSIHIFDLYIQNVNFIKTKKYMPNHSLDSSFARGIEQKRFSFCFRSKPITSHHITSQCFSPN